MKEAAIVAFIALVVIGFVWDRDQGFTTPGRPGSSPTAVGSR